MKTSKLTLWATIALLFFSSCGHSHSITIDLRDYPGLDSDSKYAMIIENPNDSNSIDTIYWSGDKLFNWEMNNNSQEYLAFVEVNKVGNDSTFEGQLFCSVVAIEDGGVTIRALKNDSIILQGSKSNEAINQFWYGEKGKSLNSEVEKARAILSDEMKNHPDDLYGAFLYSWNVIICMTEADLDKDVSLLIKAVELKEEIEQFDSYVAKHCIITPSILDNVMEAGSISIPNYLRYIKSMYPMLFSNHGDNQDIPKRISFVLQIGTEGEITISDDKNDTKRCSIDSLAECLDYFIKKSNTTTDYITIILQAEPNVPMKKIIDVKQILRKADLLRIFYNPEQ